MLPAHLVGSLQSRAPQQARLHMAALREVIVKGGERRLAGFGRNDAALHGKSEAVRQLHPTVVRHDGRVANFSAPRAIPGRGLLNALGRVDRNGLQSKPGQSSCHDLDEPIGEIAGVRVPASVICSPRHRNTDAVCNAIEQVEHRSLGFGCHEANEFDQLIASREGLRVIQCERQSISRNVGRR